MSAPQTNIKNSVQVDSNHRNRKPTRTGWFFCLVGAGNFVRNTGSSKQPKRRDSLLGLCSLEQRRFFATVMNLNIYLEYIQGRLSIFTWWPLLICKLFCTNTIIFLKPIALFDTIC